MCILKFKCNTSFAVHFNNGASYQMTVQSTTYIILTSNTWNEEQENDKTRPLEKYVAHLVDDYKPFEDRRNPIVLQIITDLYGAIGYEVMCCIMYFWRS